mmetsp:Transcript_3228/g.9066  ORF Transcript_3228/g.9066 Transcript_3228/m.9066 type:complete len:395 (-) Transcript_3228:120-1304(-)
MGQGFGHRRRVGHHAHGTIHGGQIAVRNVKWLLVVDTAFETTGTPVDKLNRALILDHGHRLVHGTGCDITAIQQTSRHVPTMAGVAFRHHVLGFKGFARDFGQAKVFVMSLGRRHYGCVGSNQHVKTGIGDQVGGKFCHIHIECTVKTQGCRQRGDDLSNQAIQTRVGRSFETQIVFAHIVQSFVIKHHGTIRVLQQSVSGQDTIVRLDHRRTNLGRRSDGKGKLGFASVIDTETLQQEASKPRARSTARGMKDEESLQARALIRQFAKTIHDIINHFFPHRVVTSSIVVGSVFLSGNDLIRMIQLLVLARTHLVAHGRFQVDKQGPRNVLAGSRFAKKGVVRIIFHTRRGIRWHVAVGVNTMFQAVEFPTLVSDLNTGLSEMNRDTFTHDDQQ